MRSLTRDLRIPEHLMTSDAVKTGEEFDVIKYFAVLPNLSMDGGYTLDYVYRYTGGIGHPVLIFYLLRTPVLCKARNKRGLR